MFLLSLYCFNFCVKIYIFFNILGCLINYRKSGCSNNRSQMKMSIWRKEKWWWLEKWEEVGKGYVGLKESEEVRLPFADRFGLGPTYHLYACLSYCLCCGVLTFSWYFLLLLTSYYQTTTCNLKCMPTGFPFFFYCVNFPLFIIFTIILIKERCYKSKEIEFSRRCLDIYNTLNRWYACFSSGFITYAAKNYVGGET